MWASSSTAHRTTSSTTGLRRHHAIPLHGTIATRPASLLSGTTLLHTITSTACTAHHLWDYRVRRLHASWSGTRHVHGHRSRISSHRTTHWPTHHARLPRGTRLSSTHVASTARSSALIVVLRLKLRTSDVSPLCQCNKDGLASDDLAVHLIHCSRRVLRSRKANESKTSRDPRLEISHHTRGGDGSHGAKFIPQHIITYGIIQILDIQVHTLELGNTIHLL
mmetsp:Transcript_1297/g.1921  ORF Transcript_1297/g.1921 Transcript_1297/m.1921 type:complete len:222 (-) Transcript_1297:853-1518(-)